MLRTDHFIRFERVSSVRETDRGLEADVHGERFRVEVCRPDVVRLRMSRGGAFDDKPHRRAPGRRLGRARVGGRRAGSLMDLRDAQRLVDDATGLWTRRRVLRTRREGWAPRPARP